MVLSAQSVYPDYSLHTVFEENSPGSLNVFNSLSCEYITIKDQMGFFAFKNFFAYFCFIKN